MNPEFNIKMYQILNRWNPMQLEDANEGDMEYYEIMDIIHQKLPHQITIEKIQDVFKFSFDSTPSKSEIEHVIAQIYVLDQSCEV
ncbi:DUF1871 family protein [Macrococcoides canis]|uniref:DUF1871 family protein n=1 Tax=Macrococcoides canis TaxID=1855823 RepID=A0A4V3BG70_9STAP|nr:DUF1871 family protein [Macrococcus canis]MEE1107471.1 DUF1871 family protein [Macrococcus canis]TDM17436.1 DUF1871 family protein [Macrococcus canis]TDM20765.1 DUF1871 family protein [Macrococcus canis]TDM24686.1 DUF1871 family protein [Macrococcus canis]TDM32360.1 DUF1871 family protein [Macrococcus canis]